MERYVCANVSFKNYCKQKYSFGEKSTRQYEAILENILQEYGAGSALKKARGLVCPRRAIKYLFGVKLGKSNFSVSQPFQTFISVSYMGAHTHIFL